MTYTGDYILWWSSTNGITFTSGTGGSGTDASQGATSGWVDDTWYHIALVRSGTALKVYRDGTSLISVTNSIDFDNTGNLFIASADGSGYFTGYMDEIRISKGIARWTANFTPEGSAYEITKRILSGSVDISGQPSGTNMKYKIETLNDKNLKLHGASLLWV